MALAPSFGRGLRETDAKQTRNRRSTSTPRLFSLTLISSLSLSSPPLSPLPKKKLDPPSPLPPLRRRRRGPPPRPPRRHLRHRGHPRRRGRRRSGLDADAQRVHLFGDRGQQQGLVRLGCCRQGHRRALRRPGPGAPRRGLRAFRRAAGHGHVDARRR